MGWETARKVIREAAIRPLSPFILFLGYQLYSCAVTRLSQEVISINCKFLDKIFLQLHPVSEISEKTMEESDFLLFHFIPYEQIQLDLFCDKIFQNLSLQPFAALVEDCFNFNRGYQNLVKN